MWFIPQQSFFIFENIFPKIIKHFEERLGGALARFVCDKASREKQVFPLGKTMLFPKNALLFMVSVL